MDPNLCRQNPQAHFAWFGIVHYARYLNKLQYGFLTGTASTGLQTSALVKEFYVSRQDPSELILPVSIISGAAAALSAVFPPAAVVAGAGSVINGALTQAGLNKPESVFA